MATLIIGNRNYSSWSMRAGLAIRHSNIDFHEEMIPLRTPDTKKAILAASAAAKVPILIDEVTIWDSLAICEYLAERSPQLWPQAPLERARARSICAEMHAGFSALRDTLPMNLRARGGPLDLSPLVHSDIARITSIWRECRARSSSLGPWLFGEYCVADSMYAPIVSRFVTYKVSLDNDAQNYVDTTLADPAYQQWSALAHEESECIDAIDALL
jgi:glutathione S-transferase